MENLTEDELLQKHKKEKKELQAQIQNLKKITCKGDRKKKKELAEEIARREADLEKKHKEEYANFVSKLSQLSLVDAANPGKEGNAEIPNENGLKTEKDDNKNKEAEEPEISGNHKVSRAQRRRQKKAKEEEERNKLIIEQEAENEFGKRNLETQAIQEILLKRDLMLYEISSDGHCLYNAIAHQFKQIDQTPIGLQDLRTKTAIYLQEHMNEYLPFLTNPRTESTLTPAEFENYCQTVKDTAAWGGAVELQVLSHILKCPIEVVQASGGPYMIGEEYDENRKIIVTYHRYMYELGAHYNSVTKYVQKDE